MNLVESRLSFLLIPILIIAIYLFLNFLPVILIAGVIIWAAVKGIHVAKNYFNKERKVTYSKINDDVEVAENNDPFDFSNKNVIDVEYTDAK